MTIRYAVAKNVIVPRRLFIPLPGAAASKILVPQWFPHHRILEDLRLRYTLGYDQNCFGSILSAEEQRRFGVHLHL
jgi:hypothetical protein